MEEIWGWVIIGVLTILIIVLFGMIKWRKQSWEGVVISKYTVERVRKSTDITYYIIQVCSGGYDQTVQTFSLGLSAWESIEIGNYVIKKSGSDSIEQRTVQGEEAKEVIHALTLRLSHIKTRVDMT